MSGHWRPGERPVGPNHALLIGELFGLAARLERTSVVVLDDEQGHHSDEFILERPSGFWRVSVKPELVIEP